MAIPFKLKLILFVGKRGSAFAKFLLTLRSVGQAFQKCREKLQKKLIQWYGSLHCNDFGKRDDLNII
jgi:hypothetical protein